MEVRKMTAMLCLLFFIITPLVSFAADGATVITPKQESLYVATGKTADIRLTIEPRVARAKGVTYASDNEAVATVNARGRVTGVAEGQCNIVVTSKYDQTSIKIPVAVVLRVKQVSLSAPSGVVRAGETLQLTPSYAPEEATVQQVTYKSTNSRIASVNENGLVTGVKAGKVSIVATAVDGSNARGKINLTVEQPVLGVSFKTPHVRVGVNYHGTFTAIVEPKNATNKAMTWVTGDAGIATVSGSKNSVRIVGHRWGQTTITGTTQDGGYQVSFLADIGSLRHAVRISKLKIKDGKPSITLVNNSNLYMTEVRYLIKGYDDQGNQIPMSRKQATLVGTYDLGLAQNEYSEHGSFNFLNRIAYPPLYTYEMAITGWSTDTGYYNSQGALVYNYDIPEDNYEWIPNT